MSGSGFRYRVGNWDLPCICRLTMHKVACAHYESPRMLSGEGPDGGSMRDTAGKPLGFRLGAYRKQRRWEVRDVFEDGYLERLPSYAQRWYERFLRETYAVDAKAVREGLHHDRLKPEHVEQLPVQVRRWWGRQQELWPAQAVQWAAKALGLGPKDLDSTLRRGLYVAQNAAGRDVMSLGRTEPLEEGVHE